MPSLLTVEKLKQRVLELHQAAIRATRPIDPVHFCPAPGAPAENFMAPPPPADAPTWQPLRVGETWGGDPHDRTKTEQRLGWGIPADAGHNYWLRFTIQVPPEWRGQTVRLHFAWEGEGQASVESILYVNGTALAGIDEPHPAVVLPAALHDGSHAATIRAFAPFRIPFGGLTLQLRDDAIGQLAALMVAALGAAETMRDSDTARHALIERLNSAYNALDLAEGWQSETFAHSARAALTMLRASLADLPSHGHRPTILATGHGHMDVAWLWPLWRTRQKIAHTAATALHLMEQFPDYHFSMSQPQTYAFLQQDDPELYARVKQKVAEGRFEPVGMMWLETDCNVPSGESLARQLLQGNTFFEKELGRFNHVVWLPDVFGYSAALPQLMRLAGIDCFMTTKISWNQFNRMPCDTFRWRGIDGSEVLAHFVTATDEPVKPNPSEAQFYTYNGIMLPGQVFGTWNHYRQKAVSDEALYIFGHGDGGGGPTEEMLALAQAMADLPSFPQVKLGRVEQFFERLYQRAWNHPQTPTWVGELYLEFHRGTYTSQARTKQHNRRSELLLREAEWLDAWAHTLGRPSDHDALGHAWRLVLLNQFHDILPGSSVPVVYEDSNRQFADVRQIAEQTRDAAAAFVLAEDDAPVATRQTPTTADQALAPDSNATLNAQRSAYTILNALPWPRTEAVEIALADGEETPQLGTVTQPVEMFGGGKALLAEASVPAFGYAAPGGTRPASAGAFTITRDRLLSEEYELELDAHGEIARLYDRRSRREVILPGATGNQLVLYEDRPLFWDAWDIDAFYEEKPTPVHDTSAWRVTEEGPLRAAVEITRRVGKSVIRQKICLWRDTRRIDFVTEVDWQERQRLLRVLFPLNINATRATCEIQFGAVERPTHRNTSWDWARFEVCAHKWVDVSEGGYGVALLNDGKYGHSLHNTTLGISLLKAATHPDPLADQGQHRFTYSLLPHAGDWQQGQVVRRAYELNAPLRGVRVPAGAAVGGPSSFLDVDSEHVVVETVKRAEDGDGLIVRMYEAHNQRGQARITFGRPVASASVVDLLERDVGAAEVEGASVSVAVRPFEVKTLRVRLG
jgi:alpha-mannosidase